MSQELALQILIGSLIVFIVMIVMCFVSDHWIQVKDLAYMSHKKLHFKYRRPKGIIRVLMNVLYFIQK